MLKPDFNLTKPNWEPYRGNNHTTIPSPDVTCGGSVSFKRHIGKPLTNELWEDLIHRLTISGLCVYRFNDAQWCIGWGSGHCIIQLDENENVSDIHFNPYRAPLL